MRLEKCEACGRRVAWVGVWANLLLVILKFIIGFTSGSKALFADGLHSLSNIITAFAILVSRRFTHKRASERFAYGFGKAEFLAAGFVSLLIIVVACLLISVSIKHLLYAHSSPHFTAVIMAVISIISNELLFRYMKCASSQLKSQTILANAWANRADSFSSCAVIIGVFGSRLGIPHLDPIAALVVVGVIVKISMSILIDSVRALMDASVNPVYSEEINDILRHVDGVQAITRLKTRQVGHYVWAEMDIHVDPICSLANGNMIGREVKAALLDKIGDFERITVHIVPVAASGNSR